MGLSGQSRQRNWAMVVAWVRGAGVWGRGEVGGGVWEVGRECRRPAGRGGEAGRVGGGEAGGGAGGGPEGGSGGAAAAATGGRVGRRRRWARRRRGWQWPGRRCGWAGGGRRRWRWRPGHRP